MNTIDEGYIKYICEWNKTPISVPDKCIKEINEVRNELLILEMIGKIIDGPGFGNISIRIKGDQFFVSSTNTGHLKKLCEDNISLVTKTEITNNRLWCKGNSQASSESLTHAAIYNANKNINGVIHIHHKLLWNKLLNIAPTTSPEIAYGTVEMADEISKIAKRTSNKLIVLGGHEDGIITFGASLNESCGIIKEEYLNI